jgi:hypothetical protein
MALTARVPNDDASMGQHTETESPSPPAPSRTEPPAATAAATLAASSWLCLGVRGGERDDARLVR